MRSNTLGLSVGSAPVALFVAMFGFLTGGEALAGPAKTGQGIMVDMSGEGDFIITQNEVWKYCNGPDGCTDVDGNAVSPASSYFTNAWDGNAPTVSCDFPTRCTSLGTPPSPGVPSPDASWVVGPGHGQSDACGKNKCNFWNGAALDGVVYTQTATATAGSGNQKRTATYTYTYKVLPVAASYAAKTAWFLFRRSGGTTATITLNAYIAGESLVVNNTFPCKSNVPGTAACGKISFNLGVPGYYTPSSLNIADSRVQNLKIEVKQGDNVVNTIYPEHEIQAGTPFGSLTFTYATNAGSNGNVEYLQNGDAKTIMLSNDVPGGGFGPTDLEWGVMTPVQLSLGAGNYSVTLTGEVKTNSALASLPFSVTNEIHVSAESCTN
jgi:hypothetical protein